MDKKSYNVGVYLIKPRGTSGAFDLEVGNQGKFAYDKQKKELRFKIYQATKKGIMYNNEAIKQEYIQKRFVAGKYSPVVFLSPNKQGWYQPVHVQLDSEGVVAKVENADISYYQTELEQMDALFNNKSFMEKYYLLILVILFIICICILWYMAGQVHKAAELQRQSAEVMSASMRYMADRLATNSTGPSQVIAIG
jgi:hypothetical protein